MNQRNHFTIVMVFNTLQSFYISEEDLCKLTCVSASSGEVVTFDTLVDNGTPCTYDEPNNICLDGTCIVGTYLHTSKPL